MPRNPQDLHRIAEHCRFLASSCVTEEARRPLNEVADELDREAEEQERRAWRTPVGFGRS